VYPNSKIQLTQDGPLYNVVISNDKKKLYNSQDDGYIGYENAEKMILKIQKKL
jgi:hypothetical protein